MTGYDDEPDWEPDPQPDWEPDPEDHPDFAERERARVLASLTRPARLAYRARSLAWSLTWRWRISRHSGPFSDDPPF